MVQRKRNKQVTVQLRPRRSRSGGNTSSTKSKKSEVTAIGQILRSIGGVAGGALGAYAGAPAAGSAVGTGLGAAVSRWLGQGDYEVKQNSIVGKLEAGASVPAMHKNGQSIVVRHKEFVTKITSAINFTVQNTYTIQPGLESLFPWLSGIAHQYEQYEIKGLVYHYMPASGTAVSGTNPALGTVMVQTSYRPGAAAPSSKAELLNEYWASSSVPSQAFAHPIECSTAETPFKVRYVRGGPVPSGDTQAMYDYGTTYVAVDGCLADGNYLGDLWVTYEIELKKPVVLSDVASPTLAYVATTTLTTATGLTMLPVNWDTTYTNTLRLTTGNTATGAASNLVTFPRHTRGTYFVCVRLTRTAAGALSWQNAPTFVNMTLASSPNPTYITSTTSTVAACYMFSATVTNPAEPSSFTLPNCGTFDSTGGMSMVISRIG